MILAWILGCDFPELSQEWKLDRLRLLAIAAEPAEPQPGDFVSFTSLSYTPDGEEAVGVWWACVDGLESGCAVDASLFEQLENADELTPAEVAALYAELQAAGFVGIDPGTPLVWAVPEVALEGLTEAESLEGRSATVQVTLTTEAESDPELVIRRVPVSLATTPNSNPAVGRLEVEGVDLAVGAELVVDAGATVEVEAFLSGSPEEYAYVTTEGVSETRTEELTWRWYTDLGELASAGDVELDVDDTTRSAVSWTAPEDAGSGVVHAVVLDGRGGMGWVTVAVLVQ